MESLKEKLAGIGQQLEINDIEFIQTILLQVMDNHDDLQELAEQATHNKSMDNLALLHHEFARMSARTESLFNLMHHLAKNIESVRDKAAGDLGDLAKMMEGVDVGWL